MRWVAMKMAGSEVRISLGKAFDADSEYVGNPGGVSYPFLVLAVDDVQKCPKMSVFVFD